MTVAGVLMCERSVATCAERQCLINSDVGCRVVGTGGLARMARKIPRDGDTEYDTHTNGVDDIVERELSNGGVELEEKREGLTDTTCWVRLGSVRAVKVVAASPRRAWVWGNRNEEND